MQKIACFFLLFGDHFLYLQTKSRIRIPSYIYICSGAQNRWEPQRPDGVQRGPEHPRTDQAPGGNAGRKSSWLLGSGVEPEPPFARAALLIKKKKIGQLKI